MSTEACPICCNTYNNSFRKKIKCPIGQCKHHSCKQCIRTYLTSSTQDPHCMECKGAWDQQFIVLNLNRSFISKEYAAHRRQLLFEREISKLPATMEYAGRKQQHDQIQSNVKDIQSEIRVLQTKMKVLRKKHYDEQMRARRLLNPDTECSESPREKRKFVMPCPVVDCRGFLSSQYRCEICKTYACPKCFEIIGANKTDPHTCLDSNIKTAEFIKKDTKPCPCCGTRISKISGCDQMWCVECHQAFSWRTGKIETGTIHNPHFYEYKRNHGDGEVIRAPGDVLCGGLCSWQQLNNRIIVRICPLGYQRSNYYSISARNQSLTNKITNSEEKELCESLLMLHRMIVHISRVDLPSLRTRVASLEDSKDLRVDYILKKITKDSFKKQIYRNDIQRRKLTELLRIYELIHVCGIELFANRINDQASGKSYVTHTKNELLQFTRLRDYCNEQFEQISITYNQNVPQISQNWQIRSKKFNITRLQEPPVPKPNPRIAALKPHVDLDHSDDDHEIHPAAAAAYPSAPAPDVNVKVHGSTYS